MKGKEGNGKRTCRRCMGLAAFWAGDLESHQDTELTVTVPRSKVENHLGLTGGDRRRFGNCLGHPAFLLWTNGAKSNLYNCNYVVNFTEPMLTIGSINPVMWNDDWTVVTEDGSLSAQFEHTILITPDGAEIMTEC
ncbi:Methionine aminopeptidase 1D, chloroplastic/mitochondrial [Glycine soja]|uniref:Methionine aminopeptidase 1D, chloroplastic/mitochondrial n=1 Tax=Glycine soja TaxID=3848 RepID=A0A445HXH9_GLYSO|nr:Methionine aminopeptidase 1D, chloroplastic/mitochondrial [Glycine soja]